jgi:GTP pyrophosphokinase/guanosine-3',5'-bis(diphosphate) 3'-pyrophosphohydrolase
MDLDYGVYQKLVEEKKQILFKSAKSRLNKKQFEAVKLAFEVASHAHFTQKRKSGEPYITHPVEVATIISEWELDEQTIAGALLHDVVEDTSVSKADLEQIFGHNIAELVDGVTKLEKLNFESEEVAHAEYFRKVVLAMAKDIRVILIKLADRLHNMLTLASMRPEKRHRIALETMEIYVPIANKIGLHKVHLQLADESFRHLHPLRYFVLSKAVNEAQKKRLPIVEEILYNISNALKSNAISAQFVYRQRTIYNLYRRMQRRQQGFNRIYDIFEIKIVVKKIRDCYLALGVLHSLYQPLPGKFKDYIAIPKSNGYQSLHSTLMGPHGTPLQIHIRTEAMEEVAEKGIISHWLKHQRDEEFFSAQQRTTVWINNILDIQSSSFSANEFLASLKQDLSPEDIYVFTPKGKIILLPKGSTPLDFAYFIHSDIGNHCYQARVNQKITKLDAKLQNGDVVDIITREEIEPNDQWLSSAVSGKAISKIKQYLKEQKYDEDVSNGVKLINLGLELFEPRASVDETILAKLVETHYPRLTVAELEHRVGIGNIPTLEVVKQILAYPKEEVQNIRLSLCQLPILQDLNCMPLPGEKILAKISRHGELVLHKPTCKQTKHLGLENLTLVHIINDTNKMFSSKIQALISNKPGTFTKFAAIIAEKDINIEELAQEIYTEEFAFVRATLGVSSLTQIEELQAIFKITDFIEKVKLL